MKRAILHFLLVLCLIISTSGLAYSGGDIVFVKSEYTREGFEQTMSRERTSGTGWWELFRRDICTINPDGTEMTQLTENGVSYKPHWSPDGRKIAFLSSPPPSVSLFVMDEDGSNKKELIQNLRDIHDFDWSPDGTAILAYVKTRDGRDPEETWIVTLDGEAKRMGSSKWAKGWNHWAAEGATVLNPNRRLIDGLPDGVNWPEWSYDGKYLAFIHEGILAIVDVSVIGMPEDWRTSNLEPPCDRIGDWADDNSKIMFFIRGNVCSINLDGTGVINLSMSSATDACWNANGSRVAFTGYDGRKSNTEIFIMNADGSDQRQITNTNYFHMDVDWR